MLVVFAGLPGTGKTGYAVAQEIARSCPAVGTPVVIDAVSPVPEARRGWRSLADVTDEHLMMVEVQISDQAELRQRVEGRRSDIDGLTVPTWQEFSGRSYVPWDGGRDGPRLTLVNDGDPTAGVAAVLPPWRTRVTVLLERPLCVGVLR